MKKLFQGLIFTVAFLIGAAAVFFAAAIFLEVDVFGVFVTSASRAVGIFGDHFPTLHTRFGDVQIKTRSSGKGQAVDIGCANCQLANKVLASKPLTTPQAILVGTLFNKRFLGKLSVENLSVDLDALWEKNNVSGSFSIPDTQISALYYAVRTIVPEAENAKILGHLSGKGKFSWPKLHFVFDPKIEGFAVQGLVEQVKYLNGPFEYEVEDQSGLRVMRKSGETTPDWVSLEQVGKILPSAILAIEDRGFYDHPGYDMQSMIEASTNNKKEGKIRRGASTVSQQLAKNLFLTDERTYARKLRELLYTVEMEKELGKRRIMELYVNIVEWGPNIFGAKAAARIYFNKEPSELAPEEAAWLASILRGPKRAYEQQFLKNNPNDGLVAIALERMNALSEGTRQAALMRQIHFAPPPK